MMALENHQSRAEASGELRVPHGTSRVQHGAVGTARPLPRRTGTGAQWEHSPAAPSRLHCGSAARRHQEAEEEGAAPQGSEW